MAYDRLDRHAWTREHPTGGDLGQQVERHTYDRNGIDGSNGYGLLYQSLSYDSGATNSTGTWTGLKRNETFDARGRTTQTRTWIENNAGNRWWWRSRQTFGPANQTQTITYPNAAPSNATPGTAYEYDYNQNTGLQQRLTRLDDGQVIAKNANYNPRRQLLSLRLDAAAGDLRLRNSFMPSTHWLSDTKMGDNPGTGPNDYANVNRIAYGNLTNGGYDPNGNVLLAIDYNNAVQRQCYEYDHLDRLVTAYTDNTNSCNGHTPVGDGNYNHTGANSYGYDEIGNLTAKPGQGTYTYGTGNAGPHAVTSTSTGNTYTYDDAGNTITRPDGAGTQTLNYDLQNQLETITGTVNAEFLYDTNGIRAKRNDGTATTWYPSNGFEYKRNNTSPLNPTSTHWLKFNGNSIAYSVDGNINYVLADKVSSTSAVYDTTASASSYQRYEPFGTIRGTQTVDTDTGYTGQRADQTTGLSYYISRYYDPQLGRFTKPDIVVPNPANGQDFNRYTYVNNNPVNYNDPTGHIYENPDDSYSQETADKAIREHNRQKSEAASQAEVDAMGVSASDLNDFFNPAHHATAKYVQITNFAGPCSPIPGGSGFSASGPGFPDACTFSGSSLDVTYFWEVKFLSPHGIKQGAEDVARYARAARAVGEDYRPGSPVAPALIPTKVGPLVVLNGSPGVVHYTTTQNFLAWQRNPEAYPALAEVAALSTNKAGIPEVAWQVSEHLQPGSTQTLSPGEQGRLGLLIVGTGAALAIPGPTPCPMSPVGLC